MMLDLRKIIEAPGKVEFSYRYVPDDTLAEYRFAEAVYAEGTASNTAGVLSMRISLQTSRIATCDRCLDDFAEKRTDNYAITLSSELSDTDNPDIYPLSDDSADLAQIVSTLLILNHDTKTLCSDSCKGICANCGTNLNHESCTCTPAIDPRLAILSQFLDS